MYILIKEVLMQSVYDMYILIKEVLMQSVYDTCIRILIKELLLCNNVHDHYMQKNLFYNNVYMIYIHSYKRSSYAKCV